MENDPDRTLTVHSLEHDAGGLRSLVATLVLHPDPRRIGEVAYLLDAGRRGEARLSRSEPVFRPARGGPGRPLETKLLSRVPLVLTASRRGLRIALEPGDHRKPPQITLGGAPPSDEPFVTWDALERGLSLTSSQGAVVFWLQSEARQLPGEDDFGLVGESAAMGQLRRRIEQTAGIPVTVLLRGATGVGKERVARAIHARSKRAGRFVAVNMAGIPEGLAEAVLFGAKKGSHSTATTDQEGHFQAAAGGTLFLDEIGDTAASVQPKLLRALQEREVQRVGDTIPRNVDFRLVAATDADLDADLESGKIDSALYERLRGAEIAVPTLAERRSDIPLLFRHFLERFFAEYGGQHRMTPGHESERCWLPAWFMDALMQYPWPRNVRELENVAREVAIANRGEGPFELRDELREALCGTRDTGAPAASSAPIEEPSNGHRADQAQVQAGHGAARANEKRRRPSELDAAEIEAVHARNGFNVEKTARELGISKVSLYALGIPKSTDFSAAQLTEAIRAAGGDLDRAAARLRISTRSLRIRASQLNMPL